MHEQPRSYVNPEVADLPTAAIREAVDRFPTPFFIYDERRIRSNCRRFQEAFRANFPTFKPLYAVKANTNPEILKIIFSEGWGADCSSEAEAWITRKLGGWGMYTGNYTTEEEFRFVRDCGMLINLDDVSMVPVVEKLGVPEFLSFRVNPGIAKGGMESLIFAGDDAKFGVRLERIADAYRQLQRLGVKRFGLHIMTGSNVLEEEYFEVITMKLLQIAGAVKQQVGIDFESVNIGGGFGKPYEPGEKSLDMAVISSGVRRAFDAQCPKYELREPTLMSEPGRWIMADCGWLVGTVHVIKDGRRKFVGIDAGMNDLPRPSIYGAYHHVSVLGKPAEGELEEVNVVGRLCENNDQFARNRKLPPVEVGDRVVIHTAGAHCYSMGHNYNNRLRSAEYLITEDGSLRKIRRAETFDDLFSTVEL